MTEPVLLPKVVQIKILISIEGMVTLVYDVSLGLVINRIKLRVSSGSMKR